MEAALEAGIYIPHLCSHPDLEAKGGCSLCSVEVEGLEEAVPACETKAVEGMKVTIAGPKAECVRKTAMELILASHPADCTGCPKYGKCELQSMYQYMGVGPERWRKKSRSVAHKCKDSGKCVFGYEGVTQLEMILKNILVNVDVVQVSAANS